MSSFLELFSSPKVLIAMAHVPPLPGTPLYDEQAGVNGLIDAVASKPNRPLRYKQPTGTTETISNKGVTLAMADARKPRG